MDIFSLSPLVLCFFRADPRVATLLGFRWPFEFCNRSFDSSAVYIYQYYEMSTHVRSKRTGEFVSVTPDIRRF